MALILVGRRSVSHSPMHCDLVTRKCIKEWHKLGLGSSLAFSLVKTVDGAITSTWLVILSQKSMMHWIRMGNFCLIRIFLPRLFYLLSFYKNNKRIMLCHYRLMKFNRNRYHSKSDEIHLELGETLSTRTLSRHPVHIHFCTLFSFYVSLSYSLKSWEKSADFWKSYKALYFEKCYCRKLRMQEITFV